MPEPEKLFSLPGEYPGILLPGNLDLLNRPSVPNPAGGTSSVYSMSIGIDDKEYLIPRVSEKGRLMSEDEALATFEQTGNHLGVFDSPESATAYSKALHEQQEGLKPTPTPTIVPKMPGRPDMIQPAILDRLIGG